MIGESAALDDDGEMEVFICPLREGRQPRDVLISKDAPRTLLSCPPSTIQELKSCTEAATLDKLRQHKASLYPCRFVCQDCSVKCDTSAAPSRAFKGDELSLTWITAISYR